MINFTEVERIVDTYIRTAKGNPKKMINIEFGSSLIEKAYAFYYLDLEAYRSEIISLLSDTSDFLAILNSYDDILIFSKRFDLVFLEVVGLIKNKPLNILFFEFHIGKGLPVNPLLYKIDAFLDIFNFFKILNIQDTTIFEKFMDIPFFELLLAKAGQPDRLLELIREELIEPKDLIEYSKWAEIDISKIEIKTAMDLAVILNNMDSDVSIKDIIVESNSFSDNKSELINGLMKSIYRKSQFSGEYFDYLILNKIDQDELNLKIINIVLESVELENLDLLYFLIKNNKTQVDEIEKTILFDLIIKIEVIDSMHFLIKNNVIELSSFCDFYLEKVLHNFKNMINDRYNFGILSEIHSNYKEISLYNHPKIQELVSILNVLGSKGYNSVLLELQEILFFNFYMGSDDDNFAKLFPDLYKDLLFIEKYNMLNTYSDFNSYMKSLGIKSGSQRSFLKDHLYVVVSKMDTITKIISKQLVDWKINGDIAISKKERIVNSMISSIHDISNKLLIIIELLSDKDVDIEKLFEDQGQNKIETLSFIKNSGFGELKINGLFSFDGTNEELSNIISMVNNQLAILNRPKEIDHYNIIAGSPSVVQLFETKNFAKVLTFDDEFNMEKIITQQNYLLEITSRYKQDISFEMFLFINNGFSIFTQKLLMKFQFKNISGICYDFSTKSSGFAIDNLAKGWVKDYSSKNVSLLFKTEAYKKIVHYICLMTLDSPKANSVIKQNCDMVIESISKQILDKSHRNAISTVLNDTVQNKIDRILQKYKSMV